MSEELIRFDIGIIDKTAWGHHIDRFEDASIYQLWGFGSYDARGTTLNHIVMKADGIDIACCQVRLRKIPFLKTGIADINWGPLVKRVGQAYKTGTISNIIREIKREYGIKRGYLLRVTPRATGAFKEEFKKALEGEGFKLNKGERPYKTFILDLSPPLEELRRRLLQKWRNCLNKAEQSGLKIIEGTSNDLFEKFVILADEMCQRKNISFGVDYRKYQRLQEYLPDSYKMRIMVCEHKGESIGAIICSAIGDTGIYLLGATGPEGLRLHGSYLLQWRMIQWLKDCCMRYYDLGAFNPQLNPGVYHFKKGLAGKSDNEEVYLGEYLGAFNIRSWAVKNLIQQNNVRIFINLLKVRLANIKTIS